MSRQTDELLLYGGESDSTIPQPPPFDVGIAKAQLIALEDMRRSAGYTILIKALQSEAEHCLNQMDRAEQPIAYAKYGGNYYALRQACQYVDREITRLKVLLQNVNKSK